MEGENTTMADLIVKVVQEGQIAAAEEDRIWELLTKRREERLRIKSCRCLADFIMREAEKVMAVKLSNMKKRADHLYRQCIRETRVANLDVVELSENEIRKLIILAAESKEMEKEERLLLVSMIQLALDAMVKERVLCFENLKNILCDFKKAEDRVIYRENPYTSREKQKIMGWLDKNMDDVRGLAVAMWLAGDITPEEIAGLRKKNLMDSDGVCIENPTVVKKNEAEDYIALTGRRGKIISDALKLHGDEELEYIFMSDDGGEWKKLPESCVQIKMSFICRELGIAYKSFKCTEAISVR